MTEGPKHTPRLRRPAPASLSRPASPNNSQRNIPHVIAVTSGKGGVGKTNVTTNLAYCLAKKGKRVLVFDADLGLANVDVVLGLSPEFNIQHVLSGEKTLEEILINGPAGVKILPASSGVQEVTHLGDGQKLMLLEQLESIAGDLDYVLIDCAAGISENVIYFALAAQTSAVVVTPEPTSMTDAYAVVKVLSTKYRQTRFHLIVNQVSSQTEANEVYQNLLRVTDRFLQVSLDFLGWIVHDKNIKDAVRQQRLFCEGIPNCTAAADVRRIAESIVNLPHDLVDGDLGLLWRNILGVQETTQSASDPTNG